MELTPDAFKLAHQQSDVDRGPDALHHTLGKRPNQAAPGNHKHGITPGDFKWSAGVQDPFEWAEAGTEVSRTGRCSKLFALFGTSGGAGNGTTTFILPSVADRFIVGASGTKNPMTTGGADAASITLVAGNLPPHTHDSGTLGLESTSPGALGSGNRLARGTTTVSPPITSFSGTTGNGPGTSTPFNVPTIPKYLAMKGYWKT